MFMNSNMTKRSYVRRKKCFSENAHTIESTLTFIQQQLGKGVFSQPLSQLSKHFSKIIEASCWDPRSRINDEVYQRIAASKTDELCHALLSQYLQNQYLIQEFNTPSSQTDCSEYNLIPLNKETVQIPTDHIHPLVTQKVQLPPLSTLLSV